MASSDRTPGIKFALVILVGAMLCIPLFVVWLLVYDRQQQSEHAQLSIAEGWAGPQTMAGPLLVIPYLTEVEGAVTSTATGGQVAQRSIVWHELTLAPELSELETEVRPEQRTRSIYQAVVYEASARGRARFAIPQDLARLGIAPDALDLARAELRFGLSDPRGLGANPRVSLGGEALRLQPGRGTRATGANGFFAWLDAGALRERPLVVDYAFGFRGNGSLGLAPQAGETRWRLRSAWPHPSFQGGFLPAARRVGGDGFEAVYRVGNLALGQSLVATSADAPPPPPPAATDQGEPYGRGGRSAAPPPPPSPAAPALAQVSLVQPVDLYSQVDRASKYGFLFIGFTFLAFLLFDVVGGVRVSAVEYLLVGAALVLFFVLLLAFAEVIGFTAAYLVASAAIVGLNTSYSAAVLKSWRRAGFIMALLAALYAVLYVLLSLEAYSLLIGALMLFGALAAVMYLTRHIEWGGTPAGAREGGFPVAPEPPTG
jgi:inner membrane protein